jgi:hypothetical protein
MANTAFNHDPAFIIPATNTTAGAGVKWTGNKTLGESLIILDSGGNGRIGLAGDTDLITLTANTVTVAGTVAATTLTGAGAGITALAAANITASGTLPALNGAALTALTAANITASGTLPALNGAALTALTAGNITASGTLPALNGAALTALTAANITASGTLPALNGAALTALTAANITASGTLPALNGAALTALNGTQVTSGTLPAARIAADSIVEAKLNVSNGPTNGYILTARSGVAGGFTWEAAASGGVDTTGTPANNQVAVFTDADTVEGTAGLTYPYDGQLKVINASGAVISWLDGSTGQSEIRYNNAGTTKWTVGIDADASSNQKGHADDFAFYSSGGYGVVISGEGTNKFGIGTQAGIALSSSEIPPDGIQFPATAALSSSANNLDDYQEGTFTPVFQDWSYSNNEGQTYTHQVGRYVKIGRWVTIQIYIESNLDAQGLATGSQAKIDGLPYTASTGTGFNYGIYCPYVYGITVVANQTVTGMVNANTAYVVLHKWSSYTGVQPVNYSHIDDRQFSMVFTGQYETDS